MRIGVIGGGAAGMTAAIFAAKYGGDVTILEHTGRIGKKILSTGNGKCNFTNHKLSKDDYNGNHPSFTESVLVKFGRQAAVDFFESCGMLTVSKRDGYYYPYTGQAATVLNILRYQLERLGVTIVTDAYITDVRKNKKGTFLVRTKETEFSFDKMILACGGNAAPSTGSDGSGYALARAFGHNIEKPLPVLTYLKSRDVSLKELAGVRVSAKLSLYVDGKLSQQEEGELQLNKENISGIPVFQLSHTAIKALDKHRKVEVRTDFLPDIDEKPLFEKIEHLKEMYAMLPVSEILSGMLHKKVCGAVLHRSKIRFEKAMGQLSKREIEQIVSCVKEFRFEISGFPGFEAAQATMGGVDTKEIDKNMMSKLVDGLYFAGEIVDIDGRCGGYNLQWAWSSGYVAGCHSINGEVTCYESISAK
ncbi:MAG: NAD(P)/FAD-dependent oxidoreductase [Lachnospiraceae bacterium]|nr:NAD(P)/FAD-dependent oxidoreductase [Lachnospiraceae bacterium]